MLEHSNPRTHNTQHLWCEGFMICEYCRVLSIKWFIMMELWCNYIIATLINHLELNLSASYKNTHTHTRTQTNEKKNETKYETNAIIRCHVNILSFAVLLSLISFGFSFCRCLCHRFKSHPIRCWVCVCRYWNFMVIYSVSRWKSFIL